MLPNDLPDPFSKKLTRVLIPVVDQMLASSIGFPLEMLQAANTYARLKGEGYDFTVQLCAEQKCPVHALGGISILPDATFSESGQAELVIVPALWRNPIPTVKRHPGVVQWLKAQHEGGALFCVAGTGATFLAESGLLDHQPTTTHWFFLDKLQRYYPKVDFKPHHLITQSERIYCAGSVNSVADLMVHLIELFWGESVAHSVEQQFSHEIRKPFSQALFSEGGISAHQDEVIIALQSWLQQHFTEDLTLEKLAERSQMTKRTLSRRFKKATGMTPSLYIQRLRLNQATDLFKTTDLSVREAASQCGYDDPEYFGRLFKKCYQLSPSDFKRSVWGKLFYLNNM